jgi:4'-phosphopantetheinyl transferase
LLALWVRKEAFLKAAGIGLEREMQTFPAADNALLTLPRPGGKQARLQMLDVGPYWVAAVAGSPDTSIESAWLRPVSAGDAAGLH